MKAFLLVLLGLATVGCAGAAEDDVDGSGSAQAARAPARKHVGMLSVERGDGLGADRDYGTALGSYVSGIACRSAFYEQGRTHCEIVFVSADYASFDAAQRVVFEGGAASAIAKALPTGARGPHWTLTCAAQRCELVSSSPLTAQWRPAERTLTAAQIATLEAEVTAAPR
jgi:hypothetical protein